MAATTCVGIGCNFTAMDVIIPKVPSDPVIREVTSYPAEDFSVLEPQCAMVPLGRMVVRE
eukprot:9123899-Ditylum_brightwellii.AAC.1